MKIVIISRCIVPSNAPRALRATELAKYFGRKNHDVTLYGALGSYDYTDFSSKYNVKIKSLGELKYATLNSSGQPKPSVLHKIYFRLFGRLFEFPDIELAFKVQRILKEEKNIDLLITVAIPYPIHWGTAFYKKKHPDNFARVWVSDCGDPYFGNPIKKAPFYFKYIEHFWSRLTDFITIPIPQAKVAYLPEAQNKLRVIPQAFNFDETPIEEYTENPVATFAFAGNCYTVHRDPTPFLDFLCELKNDFRFYVYTNSRSFFEPYKSKLGEKLILNSFVPRANLLKELSKMDFLINFKNSSVIQSPSKLIDYALTKRPILSIGKIQEDKSKFIAFMNRVYQERDDINLEQYDINIVGEQFIKLIYEKDD